MYFFVCESSEKMQKQDFEFDGPPLVSPGFHVALDAVTRYHTEGFYVFDQLLTVDGLNALREACEERKAEAVAAGHDGAWLMELHTSGCGSWLAKLLLDPQMRAMVTAFCGPSVCLGSAQFFCKPPVVGGVVANVRVGWHQVCPRFIPSIESVPSSTIAFVSMFRAGRHSRFMDEMD